MSCFREKIKLFSDSKPINIGKVNKQQEVTDKPAPAGRKR